MCACACVCVCVHVCYDDNAVYNFGYACMSDAHVRKTTVKPQGGDHEDNSEDQDNCKTEREVQLVEKLTDDHSDQATSPAYDHNDEDDDVDDDDHDDDSDGSQ